MSQNTVDATREAPPAGGPCSSSSVKTGTKRACSGRSANSARMTFGTW